MAYSHEKRKLTHSVCAVWKPIPFTCAVGVCFHDAFATRKSKKPFRTAISPVSAQAVTTKRHVRIRYGPHNIIDHAASCTHLSSDSISPSAIFGPDTAA